MGGSFDSWSNMHSHNPAFRKVMVDGLRNLPWNALSKRVPHDPDLILSLEEHIFKYFFFSFLQCIYYETTFSSGDPNAFTFKNYEGNFIKKLPNYTIFLDKYRK